MSRVVTAQPRSHGSASVGMVDLNSRPGSLGTQSYTDLDTLLEDLDGEDTIYIQQQMANDLQGLATVLDFGIFTHNYYNNRIFIFRIL